MKLILIGATIVIGGVALAACIKRKSNVTMTSGKKVKGRTISDDNISRGTDETDAIAINGLPENLKAMIVAAQDKLPMKLSSSWLENDLREICIGDSKLLCEFVSAFIAASENGLTVAANVGEEIDADRMVPNKELPAGYRVARLVCPGIRRTATGEVLMKAVVE